MDHFINPLYVECERLLETLAHASSHQLERATLTTAKVYDELERFKIWGDNLGAGHAASTRISLDWRLRDASELKEEIIQLLEETVDALENLHEIVSGNREDQSIVIETEDDEQDEVAAVSEATELFGIVSDSTTSLFRLTLIIQKATPRDRFTRASINVQEPFDPMYDMQHVSAKFPKLNRRDNTWLQRKLATAITQRRQFFRYSRDHQERKSKVVPQKLAVARPKTDRSRADMLSQRNPESLVQTQASTLLLDRLEVARFNVDEFDDSLSQTSFATSIDERNDISKLRVPRLEEISGKSREFECPYCCTIVALRSQKQWKKHVFQDLRPYLCTSEDCNAELFSDRRAWFEHELSKHRYSYKCLFCRFQTFQSEHELQKHVSKHHSETLTSNTPEKLTEAAREAPQRFAAAECPFCDDWAHHLRALNPHISSEDVTFVMPKQFRNHLAAHMEQLALFALPKRQDDDASNISANVFAAGSHPSERSVYENDQAQSSEQIFGLTHDDYTVVLISSIGAVDELALRMLDKQHPNLPVSSFDPNHYSLGQIGYHNVVLVTPRNEASDDNVLSMMNLLQTFSKLRIAFSIENGSGIPHGPNEDPQLDLHLGDVVVDYQRSLEEELSDESNTTSTGSRLTSALPPAVRYALRSIRSQIENEGLRIRLFLDPVLASGSIGNESYKYPGNTWDRLFAPNLVRRRGDQEPQNSQTAHLEIREMDFDIEHLSPGEQIFPSCDNCRTKQTECTMSNGKCVQCEKDEIICAWQKVNSKDLAARNTREDPSIPVIHTGKIVGASKLLSRPGSTSISGQVDNILCADKDPNYLPIALPCLTIRGIADYGSDQPHFKGADWHRYAIGVATAYTMHILDWTQEPLDHKGAEWLLQKQRISGLYQSGQSIPDILDKMRKLYGFEATPFQYQHKIAAWKLVRPNNAEHRYINQQDQFVMPDNDAGEAHTFGTDSVIKCICLNPADDKESILCNGCNTWQHIECYLGLGEISEVDGSHYCIDCQPRDIDVDRVIAPQSSEGSRPRSGPPELSNETLRALADLQRLGSEKAQEKAQKEIIRQHQNSQRLMTLNARLKEEKLPTQKTYSLEEWIAMGPDEPEMETEASKREETLLTEKAMKEMAIAEWKAAEERKKQEVKEKEEEKERIGKEYLRQQLQKDGYTEEEIDRLMTPRTKKRENSPAMQDQAQADEYPEEHSSEDSVEEDIREDEYEDEQDDEYRHKVMLGPAKRQSRRRSPGVRPKRRQQFHPKQEGDRADVAYQEK